MACQPPWAESLLGDPGAEFCQRPEASPGMGTCFQQAQIQRRKGLRGRGGDPCQHVLLMPGAGRGQAAPGRARGAGAAAGRAEP